MRLLAVLLSAWLLATPVFANDTSLNVNVNPPRQLTDSESTPIRMASEHITVHFGKQRSRVEVEFTFENTADGYANCTAGFPDEDLLVRYDRLAPRPKAGKGVDERFGNMGDLNYVATDASGKSVLRDFKAWTRPAGSKTTARQPLKTELIRIERIAYVPEALQSLGGPWQETDRTELNTLMFCRAFALALDPHQKLIVGHSYSTRNGDNVLAQRLLSYTLATGRTWAGTIGQATIEVYLEDGLKVSDLHFTAGKDDFAAATNPGQADFRFLDDHHLLAVWTDFEPAAQQGYILLATQPSGLRRARRPDLR